ncbi:hypothetical protein [Streptomyces lavendulae]|uniref:hypothetical protein n=1 Tax=Streptomyces lavendulae TaxID=1914 RepID=UPI0031E9DD65
MNDIIAGDPAPTNPTAAIRDDILAGLRIAESGSIGDEAPESLLDRYDALQRADAQSEALFAASDAFEAQGDLMGRIAASKLRELALAVHTEGGAR